MLKLADENNESEEKKKALEYLNEANQKKDEFFKKTLASLPEKIKREELIEKLSDAWFATYKLRMAITGKSLSIVKGAT